MIAIGSSDEMRVWRRYCLDLGYVDEPTYRGALSRPVTAKLHALEVEVEAPYVAEMVRAALEARQPHGRLVSAAEVAEAVHYLVGPGAGSTTGTAIEVDGGMGPLRLRPTS